jgi:hypothetical protein
MAERSKMGKQRHVLLALAISGAALLLVAGIKVATRKGQESIVETPLTSRSTQTPVPTANPGVSGQSPSAVPVLDTAAVTKKPIPTLTSFPVATPMATNKLAPIVTISPSLTPTDSRDPVPTTTSLPPPTLTPMASPSAAPVFGVEMGQITPERGLALAETAGVHWVRRNGLRWADVEPAPGARHWEAVAGLETELQAAHAAGLQTILVVRRTPDWAQKVPGHYCGPVAQEALDDLAQFMAEVVERYRNPPFGVKYWELGNEPDVDPDLVAADSPFGCWGDQDDVYYGGEYYAEMLQIVYPAIKDADPEAQVLIGGLLLDKDPAKDELANPPGRFLEGVLRGGGGDFFDIVSFHGYTFYTGQLGDWEKESAAWNHRGGSVVGKAGFVREVLATYGYEKPLMLTEAGLLCRGCPSPPPTAFSKAQAAYVPHLYVRTMALGLESTIWYTLDGPGWQEAALLDKNQQPKPAYEAFRTMTALLQSAQYLGPVDDLAGLEGYVFHRPGAETETWVIWSPDGAQIALPLHSGLQRAYDLFGHLLAPTGDHLEVGFNPVYLKVSPSSP